MRFFVLAVSLLLAVLALAPVGLAADVSTYATYTVGNLDEISAGAEGKLSLKQSTLVFSDGKAAVFAPYDQITSAGMGAKVVPPSGGLKKMVKFKKEPVRRLMIVEFNDSTKKDEKGRAMVRTMTFDVEESAGEDFCTTIEERAGRKKHPGGDGWWGNSAWKTKSNGNAVQPDSLGKLDK